MPAAGDDATIDRLKRRLAREREARRQSEELLENKTRELYLALEGLQQARDELIAKEQLARELELVAELQSGLLPNQLSSGQIEVAARMVPAENVGGDYYDVIPAEDGLWLAVGDAVGHGMNAGLVMIMAQSATAAALSARPHTTPRDAIVAVNEVLYENLYRRLGRHDFLTMTLVRYYTSGRVLHAGAHEDIVVYRAASRTLDTYDTNGTWTGVRADVGPVTTNGSFTLYDGDVMLLYTDGITEAVNGRGERFGIERLKNTCLETSNRAVQDFVDYLVAAGQSWRAKADDDIAVMALRHRSV